jgi:hypothetical protein
MPADRIIPDRVGEVYYLTYNPKHKWYWLEKQTSSEPFAFVMYDTQAGSHARCRFDQLHTILVKANTIRSLPTCILRQSEGPRGCRTARVY